MGREREVVEVASRDELRAWLQANHTRTDSVWLVTWKKHVADKHVPWGALVQEALCFGWIDGQVARVDDDRIQHVFSPRRPGSAWSAVNKRHVEQLEANGLMTDAGRALIEAAKADGSWTWLDDIEAGVVPPDLQAALDGDPVVAAAWASWPPSVRKGVLRDLKSAKREATRARRLAKAVEAAKAGKRPG